MATTAIWLIIAGFVLLLCGIGLRTVILMQSSDATPAAGRVLHGQELIRQYRRTFPHSPLLLVMRCALAGGGALLLAGLALEILR